mgnify:CR=1 FL=1
MALSTPLHKHFKAFIRDSILKKNDLDISRINKCVIGVFIEENKKEIYEQLLESLRMFISHDLIHEPLVCFDDFAKHYVRIERMINIVLGTKSWDESSDVRKILRTLMHWRTTAHYNLIFAHVVGWMPKEITQRCIAHCFEDRESYNDVKAFVANYKLFLKSLCPFDDHVLANFKSLEDCLGRMNLILFDRFIFCNFNTNKITNS